MFNSEGWKVFIGDVNDRLTRSIERAPDECMTEAGWQFRRGEIFQLRQIANIEAFVDAIMTEEEEEEYASV